MTITQTTIRLDGLRFYAYHGVLPQENAVGAFYTVNVELKVSTNAAALVHDDLSGTLNYAEVYEVVKKVMAQPRRLLEMVAHDLLNHLFNDFPLIESATVCIQKDNPPIGADLRGVSVTMTATK